MFPKRTFFSTLLSLGKCCGCDCVTTPVVFDAEELASVQALPLPRHIAIIPDGNRRWARSCGVSHRDGHFRGAEVVMDIVEAAKALGLETVTVYTFSTENWNRPKEEIDVLMFLLVDFLTRYRKRMIENGVKFATIGALEGLSEEIQTTIQETKVATEACHDINLVLALNYGGRDDICRAVNALMQDVVNGKVPQNITEDVLQRYLDTHRWGNPDLFIRTSGEKRLSNFLLWQLSYSEIYFTDTLWPDFSPRDLLAAIKDYQRRERRHGV